MVSRKMVQTQWSLEFIKLSKLKVITDELSNNYIITVCEYVHNDTKFLKFDKLHLIWNYSRKFHQTWMPATQKKMVLQLSMINYYKLVRYEKFADTNKWLANIATLYILYLINITEVGFIYLDYLDYL